MTLSPGQPITPSNAGELRAGDRVKIAGSTIKTKGGQRTTPDEILEVACVTSTHIKFTDGGGWRRENAEPWPLSIPLQADQEQVLEDRGGEFRHVDDYNDPVLIGLAREAEVQTSGSNVTGWRDERQASVAEWCARCFGDDHAASLPQRGIRLAEKAIEAAQAAGCDPAMLHKLVDYVYARPVGEIGQELGGIGVTLLALANAAGLSADGEEAREVARVLAKPAKHFTERNRAKNEAGFNVTGGYPVTPPPVIAEGGA